MRKGKKKGNAGKERRDLRVESLEPKLPLAANLDVVAVNGGPDIMVLGTGDGGEDMFSLISQPLGNVVVSIDHEVPVNGKFEGDYENITQTFNIPTLEGQAASLGGKFMGFRMEGEAGNDRIDAQGLKNLEVTYLVGGDGNDTLRGGDNSYDSYDGGLGSDQVRRVDWRDITFIQDGLPSDPDWKGGIDGGNDADRKDVDELRFNGINGIDVYENTTFEIIFGTNQKDNIDSSMYPTGRPDSKGVDVNGREGNDTLIGSAGRDTLDGHKGDDVIEGRGDNDKLYGGKGKDKVSGGGGNDLVEGGNTDGFDSSDGDDTLMGGDGNDTINGREGKDIADGGAGNDKVNGDAGNDTLIGGPGEDSLVGGDGFDVADYSDSPDAVNINLLDNKADPDGHGSKDPLVDTEGAIGSANADTIKGGDDDNLLEGGDGADTIEGLAGDDTIKGGGGPDVLIGQLGNDLIEGGGGDDFIHGDDCREDVKDSCDGFVDADGRGTIGGDDTLKGDAGNDIIRGWGGDDQLRGGDDSDTLLGGYGDDVLEGDKHPDTLDGGLGHDWLAGGNDLALDKLFFEYNEADEMIVDVVLTGGLANRDEFIALATAKYDNDLVADDKPDFIDLDDDKKDDAATGDGRTHGEDQFNFTEIADIAQELSDFPFGSGNSNLFFTDYDGGDGPNGDVLSFGNTQLP